MQTLKEDFRWIMNHFEKKEGETEEDAVNRRIAEYEKWRYISPGVRSVRIRGFQWSSMLGCWMSRRRRSRSGWRRWR